MVAQHRTRKMTFRLSEEEYKKIHHKVHMSGMSQQQYLLRSSLDKEITNTDGLRSIIPELKRIGNNLNQIARTGNATGYISAEEIENIKRKEEEIWQLLKRHLEERDPIKHVINYVTKKGKTNGPPMYRYQLLRRHSLP